jgi:hypothetical protein
MRTFVLATVLTVATALPTGLDASSPGKHQYFHT